VVEDQPYSDDFSKVWATYRRLDILIKAELARAWLQGDPHIASWWEDVYVHYLSSRGKAYKYNASTRMYIYRGLLESVSARGFHWAESPITVDEGFAVVDGSHRAALALVLNASRVTVARECRPSAARRAAQRAVHPQDASYLYRVLEAPQLVAVEASARAFLTIGVEEAQRERNVQRMLSMVAMLKEQAQTIMQLKNNKMQHY